MSDPQVFPVGYVVLPSCWGQMGNSDRWMWALNIECRDWDSGMWAVTWLSACLSIDGTWDEEPIPSGRTKKWLKTHRFPLADAISLAVRTVDSHVVSGCTARQVAFMFPRVPGA